MVVMTWTDEVVTELRDLHAQKCSAREMALAVWDKFHLVVSRNAVIGKLRRLEVGPIGGGQKEATKKAAKNRKPRAKTAVRAPKFPVEEVINLPPDQSPYACTIMELTDASCRFPMGDPGTDDFRFCGATKLSGVSYCVRHSRLAFNYNPKPYAAYRFWRT